jgi:hypothetical protein
MHHGPDWAGRLVRYIGHVSLGAAFGVAAVWIIDRTAIDNHHSAILTTNHDYGLAAIIVVVCAFGALCRAAHKKRELWPLAAIYVSAVGAFAGVAVGMVVAVAWLDFFGTEPIAIQVFVGLSMLAGVIINLRSKFRKGPRRTLRTTLLSIDRFFKRLSLFGNITGYLAFRVGGGFAAAFAFYYLWNWTPTPTHAGRPDNPNLEIMTLFWFFWPVRLVVYGALVCLMWAALLDLWWFVIATLERKPLEDEKAHGKAGKATESIAIGAARGGPGKPPWVDHGYID